MAIRLRDKLKRRYEIRELLGQGQHGKTWKAWDTLSNPPKFCVIKEPLGSLSAIKELEAESAAAGLLYHKNIVPVLEFNHTDGFLVEEFVQGRSLQGKLREDVRNGTWLASDKATEIFTQVLEGLEYAHEKSRVHGDVKPGNIMLPDVGEARLTDFGVSRFVSGVSVSGGAPWDPSRAGSSSYSAPEVLSNKQWSAQSDLFSAGMIAYLLFTKRHPFVDVAGLWTATERIIDPEVSPAPVGEMAAALDPRLGRAITRLLQRDPAKRYQTAREVLDDLIGRGPATSTCRACGNENPPDAKFCNSCGGAMAEVELTGTEPDRQLSVSFSLYGAGRTDEAITIARQILAKHEDYGKGWAHLAFMLNQIRRYDEAIEAADKAIQHSPDFASGYRSKGFALSVLRRFDEAAEQFDEALARETRPRDRAQILYNKAYTLMLGGGLTEAEEAAGEALEEDPTYYKARSILNRLENLRTSG